MKKFILKSLLFFILIIISNIIYLLIIQNIDWSFKKRLESLNLNNPKYDLLVLGNSLAMDGIDTKYLSENGLPSYNLSIGGSSLKTNYIQLKEYITIYDYKPKYIILGIGTYTGSSLSSDNINPVVDFTMKNKRYGINDIPMIKFQWMFKENLKKIVSKPHREAYLENGQLKFEKKVADNTFINKHNKFIFKNFTENNLLKKMIKFCSLNNIKLIIIEMPGFKKVRHPKLFDIKILDKNTDNGILIDYNTIEFGKIFDDKKDWIGDSHLNVFGANKFTKILFRDIQKIIINTQLNSNTQSTK